MKKYLLLLLALFFAPALEAAAPSWGEPDLNGYVAEYECRAGGPHCDVDVASLVAQPCQQTITPADNLATVQSKINNGSQFICIEPGDYTGLGTISIDVDGSPAAYKVLRYEGTNTDVPWDQDLSERVRLWQLEMDGDYWIVHRLSFPGITSNVTRIFSGIDAEVQFQIIDHVLVEGPGFINTCYGGWATHPNNDIFSNNITVQNSVFRDLETCDQGPLSPIAISPSAGQDHAVVNNEVEDWCEHSIQIGNNNIPEAPGIVVENNDLYFTPDVYLANGDMSGAAGLGIKLRGTAANPIEIFHNRFWGNRRSDGDFCGTPGSPSSVAANAFDDIGTVESTEQYVIFKDNIIFDSIGGTANYTSGHAPIGLHSYIGNIYWNIRPRGTQEFSMAASFFDVVDMEFYLNTIIDTASGSVPGTLNEWFDAEGLDVRGNVLIDSETDPGDSPDVGSQVDYNVFYETTPIAFNVSSPTTLSHGIITRANSAAVSAGAIMRRGDSSLCDSATDPDCFLYEAQTSGTTASTEPTFVTTLGGEFVDGGVTWKAIRGPYTFWRTLRTTPEQIVIPYATGHVSAPEAGFVPTAGETDALGSRTAIGVNDDVAPNGIFTNITNPTILNLESGGGTAPDPQADANGYVAKYECRAGNPNCDVDVASLVTQNCQATIVPSDTEAQAEGKVNGGSQFICIEPGEYNYVLDITVSGTENARKVLRYNAVGDAGDDPWEQLDADQADLDGLRIGGDFWIIHRLTFSVDSSAPSPRIESSGGHGNHILNRLLVEGTGIGPATPGVYGYSQECTVGFSNNVTVQNSVFRDNSGEFGNEGIAVDLQCGNNLRAVNNEIYNWCSHGIQTGQNNHPTLTGLVVENNDMYITPEALTGTGESKTEGVIDTKAHGTQASPVQVFHNRIWGTRRTDTSFCGNGADGQGITVNADTDWQWYYDNIFTDVLLMANLTTNDPHSNFGSFVGNIGYDFGATPGLTTNGVFMGNAEDWEVYLNTVIGANEAVSVGGLGGNNDIQCNLFLASGAGAGTTSGTVVDQNVFYDTPVFTTGTTNLDISIIERVSDTTYSAGTIMRRTSDPAQCTAGDDPDCFLYEAQNSGTTGAGEPTYATVLGAEFIDGSITWEAVRGPHVYFRKLQTGPEQAVIPYAMPAASAPDVGFCPGLGEVNALGSRTGIGINDDVAPEGIFVADLAGTPRDPGALPEPEVFRVIDSGNTTNDTDTLITGVGNPTPGHMQFLVVSNTNSVPPSASWPDSVTGAGMVWEDLSHFHTFGNVAIAVWMVDSAAAASATDGALTISFPDPQFDFVWQWIEVDTIAYFDTFQSKSQVDAETNVQTLTFNFPVQDTDNLVLAVFVGGEPPASLSSNFELILNNTFVGEGYVNSIATAWGMTDDPSPTVTWAADGWRLGGMIFELQD